MFHRCTLKTLRNESCRLCLGSVVSADGSDCESHVAEGRFQSPHADLRADGPRIRHAILPARPTGTRLVALCQRVSCRDRLVLSSGFAIHLEVPLGAVHGSDNAATWSTQRLDAAGAAWLDCQYWRVGAPRSVESDGIGRGVCFSDCVSQCHAGCGHRRVSERSPA